MNDTNTSVNISDSWDRICVDTDIEHTNKHGIVLSSSCQSLIDTTGSTVYEEEQQQDLQLHEQQHQQYYSPTTTNNTQRTSSSSTLDENDNDCNNNEYNNDLKSLKKPLIRKNRNKNNKNYTYTYKYKDKRNDVSKSNKTNYGLVSTILSKHRRNNIVSSNSNDNTSGRSTVRVPADAKNKTTSDILMVKNKHSLKYSNFHDSDDNNDNNDNNDNYRTTTSTGFNICTTDTLLVKHKPKQTKSVPNVVMSIKKNLFPSKRKTDTDTSNTTNEYIWKGLNNNNDGTTDVKENSVSNNKETFYDISKTYSFDEEYILWFDDDNGINHYNNNNGTFFDDDDDDDDNNEYNNCSASVVVDAVSNSSVYDTLDNASYVCQLGSRRSRSKSMNHNSSNNSNKSNASTYNDITLCERTISATIASAAVQQQQQQQQQQQKHQEAQQSSSIRNRFTTIFNRKHSRTNIATTEIDTLLPNNTTTTTMTTTTSTANSSSNDYFTSTQSEIQTDELFATRSVVESSNNNDHVNLYISSESNFDDDYEPITNTNNALHSLDFVDLHVATGNKSYPAVTEAVDTTTTTVTQEEEQEIQFHLPEAANMKVDRDITDTLEACRNNRVKTSCDLNNNNDHPPPRNVTSSYQERQQKDNPTDSRLAVSPKKKEQRPSIGEKYQLTASNPAVEQSTTFVPKKERIDNNKMKHNKVTTTCNDDCSISTRSTISNLFRRQRRRNKKTTSTTVESEISLLSKRTNLECSMTRTEKQSIRSNNRNKKMINMTSHASIKFVDVDDAGSVVSAVSAMTIDDIRKYSAIPLLEIGRTKSNVSMDVPKSKAKKKKDTSSLFGFHTPIKNGSRIKTNKTTTESLPILGAAPATYTINADELQPLYTPISNDTYNALTSLATSACAPSSSIFNIRYKDDVSCSSQTKQKATNRLHEKEILDKQHIRNNDNNCITSSKLDSTKLVVEQRKKKTVLPTSLLLQKKSQSKRPILNMDDSSSSVSVVSCTTEASASSRLSILRRYTSAIGKTLQRFKQNQQQRHSSVNINRSSSTVMSSQVNVNDTDRSEGFDLTDDYCDDEITFCTEGTKENKEMQIFSSSARNLLSSTNTTSSETTSRDGVNWKESTFDFDPLDEMEDTALGALGSLDNSNDDAIDFFNTMNNGLLNIYGSKHAFDKNSNNNNNNNNNNSKMLSTNDHAIQSIINPADIEFYLNIPIRQKKRRSDGCSVEEDDLGSDDESHSTCSTLSNPTVFVDMDRYTMNEKPKVKIINHTPDKISKKQDVVITLFDEKKGNANTSNAVHVIDSGLPIRSGYLEYNLSSDSRSVSSGSKGSTSTDSRKIRHMLLKHVPVVDALTNPSIVVQEDDNDDNTTTNIIDDDHDRTNNKDLYTIPQHLRYPVSSSNQISISILLTQSQLKIFEIVSVVVDHTTEISIVLSKARAAAIDTRLAEQTYINLCNDTSDVFTLSSSVSELLDICNVESTKDNNIVDDTNNSKNSNNNDNQNDCNNNDNSVVSLSSHTRLTKNEIMKKEMEKLLLLAIPYGSTAKDCQRIRRVLWRNPRLQRWWKSQQQQQQQSERNVRHQKQQQQQPQQLHQVGEI